MATLRFRLLIAACVWAIGCQSSKPEPGGDAREGATCDAQHARALEAELAPLCPIGSMTAEATAAQAPWKPEPSAVRHDALRIEVGPLGVRVGQTRLQAMVDLQPRLVLDRDLSRSLGKGSLEWVLVIDEATSRADLHALVQGLIDAGEREGLVTLATAAVPDLPKPRNPVALADLVGRISALEPSERAMRLAETISRAMPPCPQLVEAFGAVAALDADAKCPALARGFAQGLVACGCPKEDELVTLFYALAVGSEPPTRLNVTLPITLDPTATPRPGATWGAVVSQMQASDLDAFWIIPG